MIGIIILLIALQLATAFWITIPEGHIGVKKHLGKIQNETVDGIIIYIPGVQTIEAIKYIQDHDEVNGLRCVSGEGVDVVINSIQIANRIEVNKVIETTKAYGTIGYDKALVVDPLAQKMRELCAERTVDEIEIQDFHLLDDLLKSEIQAQNDKLNTGITIDWVRITGITIPTKLKEKRVQLAEEKANAKIAEEVHKREKTKQEHEHGLEDTQQKHEMVKARKESEKALEQVNAQKREEDVKNAISLAVAETKAKETELENKGLLGKLSIPGYVAIEQSRYLSMNNKVVYGDSIPTVLFDPSRS